MPASLAQQISGQLVKGVFPIALILRSSLNATGAITFTGNTLGLSRSGTEGEPGTQDSIGAFITTNAALRFGSYPAGTTNNYANNQSAALLSMPAGSAVLYAELIWGGSYRNGNVNLSGAINNPISFTTPLGTFSITPDTVTSNEVDLGSGAFAYVRTANVTPLVRQAGPGTYAAGGVVGTIVINNDSTANHAGWTLAVIYENPSLPFRNMSLRAGAVLVQSASPPVNTTITGFATPTSGTIGGRALFSAQEGDANRTGDQALFGPTASSLAALSGPNNFAANFFASQINNDTGQLNTTGTFGNRNQTNGAPGTNISGGRQGWDITNVDVSARLVNNQNSAVLQLTTSGDAYVLNANAIQIDINAPKVSVIKAANVTGAVVGDTITYSVTVSNTGTANAGSVVVSDELPAGLAFTAGSVTVGGASRPAADIKTGVSIGTLAPGAAATVTYRATVISVPNPQSASNTANAAFSFQSVAGGPTITGVIPSNTVTLPIYAPILTLVKSADTANATVGDIVTYTLQLTNTGNAGASVTLTDNIPAGASYIPNSFRLNGIVVVGANPAAGVPIGTVNGSGGTATAAFQVRVESLPNPPQLTNQGSAGYTFRPPDGRTFTGTAVSNTVVLPVALPNVTVSKSADRTAVTVGETITYTLVIANNGTSPITNVNLADPLPAALRFAAGSVTLGGINQPAANPQTGIAVGTLAAGASATVSFQAAVVSPPDPAQLANTATAAYSSGTFSGISASSTLLTPVYQPVIAVRKSADRSAVAVGETVTYTIVANNSGNIAASATVTDTIPAGTVFVPGSVTVNGTGVPAASPVSGIGAGELSPGASATVTFQVQLQTLPNPPRIANAASVSFTYQLPDGRSFSGSSASNTVMLPATVPSVAIAKRVNAAAAAVGDTLTYTLNVSNTGSTAVNDILVSDPLPAGAAFETGSVTVRGTARSDANPAAGISLGTLAAGDSADITFRIRVLPAAQGGTLGNQAFVSYRLGSFNGSSASGTVSTTVVQPQIQVVKNALVPTAIVGVPFAYVIRVTNTGNAEAAIVLTDPLPPEAEFVTNSVIVGGTPMPGVTPTTGIRVDALPPGASVEVSFQVTVTTQPASQQTSNRAVAAYTFTLPDGRTVTQRAESVTTALPVSAPQVTVGKRSSAAIASAGETLRYTVEVTNSGNAPANQVIAYDPIPAGTELVPGSVAVNGVSRPSADPSSGIAVGVLNINSTAVLTYEVRITMPVNSPVVNQSTVSFTSGTFSGSSASNKVATPIFQPEITLGKNSIPSIATVGDTVSYTINITNTGNIAALVTLSDNIPAGTTFVANSVIVNGSQRPGASPVDGIVVGAVAPNASAAVTFSVVIDELPPNQQLVNSAVSTFTFTPPDGRQRQGSAASNIVVVPVSSPNVTVVKSASSPNVFVGDTLTYSIAITNNGLSPVNSIITSDIVPPGSIFVTGSVVIRETPAPRADPAAGIIVGTIASLETAVVTFDIRVVSLPNPAELNNQASVSFTSGTFSGLSLSNVVTTPVFTPIVNLAKSSSADRVTVGDTVTFSFNVTNSGNYAAAVTLTDPLEEGTAFVPNSVIVGGTPVPGATPAGGIPVGSVPGGTTVPVSFSVVVHSLPPGQQLTNQGTAAFEYITLDNRTLTGTAASNTVTVQVSTPEVSVVKSTAATDAVIGDPITYSTVITNNGTAPVNNVVFTDVIPAGTAFVRGSVTINGAPQASADPARGVSVGSIDPGATAVVAFTVSVTSLPNPAQLSNAAAVSFTSGTFSATAFSNAVITPVYQPIIAVTKSASETDATVGDTIVFSFNVSNNGNLGALVTLTDLLSEGLEFEPNSVVVGGVAQPGASPAGGIAVGAVMPGSTIAVSFHATVTALPPSQRFTNQAAAAFTFTPPDGRQLQGSAASNPVTIRVFSPDVLVVKSADVPDAAVGETITYTVTITNNGITTINNVVMTDPVPEGTRFNAGSVTVNGNSRPEAVPSAGIVLGSIAPNASVVVTFGVTVL
ncbi:hypothetical protein ACFFK0_14760 [Paenibacillus chartarius]|uniref:DUF11 domain-containing protein n=1 Tax=Paenibacillus chartarius TaxID=747481 RepID=A0ABV6DM26_9BACL